MYINAETMSKCILLCESNTYVQIKTILYYGAHFTNASFYNNSNSMIVSFRYHLDFYRIIAKIVHMTRQLCCRDLCRACCDFMAGYWITMRRILMELELK